MGGKIATQRAGARGKAAGSGGKVGRRESASRGIVWKDSDDGQRAMGHSAGQP